ncbi:MAG: tryptophan synthase subunit alpha [Gemmatimonadaceae bacterium]
MASASATTSPDLLAQRFDTLRTAGRRALVPYLTAGHPDPARSLALLQGLADAGADAIEVGVPFSDPMADGPVIQGSSQQALRHGMTLDKTFELIARAKVNVPIVLFSYLNPLIAAGENVLARASEAGCAGVLVTDLPVGADPDRESWLGDGPLAFIRLVAPTTPSDRMREIARHGRGFVYLISRMGVTGMSQSLPPELGDTIGRLRAVTTLPVCVGFGISRPEQAKSVSTMADGVVVGSAIVRAAEESVDEALSLARAMRAAIDER